MSTGEKIIRLKLDFPKKATSIPACLFPFHLLLQSLLNPFLVLIKL